MASCSKVDATQKKRSIVWSDEATNNLIELWGKETIQFSLHSCKSLKETSQVYKTAGKFVL